MSHFAEPSITQLLQANFAQPVPALASRWSTISPATLGAVAPFMQAVFQACHGGLARISAHDFSQLQKEYAQEWAMLMNAAMARVPMASLGQSIDGSVSGAAAGSVAQGLQAWIGQDKRFANPAWHDHGVYELMAAVYSLNARYTKRLVALVPDDHPDKRRMDYALEQMVGAMSPANFFATNPEAQQKLIETQGESLRQAIDNVMEDLKKGRISQTDETAFEVGRNVATTPGVVVYENELFQLLQYQPQTAQVASIPLLFVPPCINKYYILDLQPNNSLVNHMVQQGHTVFLVSWVNPSNPDCPYTWDDYVEKGILEAMRVMRAITGQNTLNAMGFCVGGTLLATALSTLAARGEHWVNSLTLLTTLLDFSDTGALGVFVTEEQVKAREDTIGQKGLMPGQDLASAFSSLRPNDLIWNYVVNNYLKGEKPPVFDLLYWNSDSTHLSGPMFSWYLRHTYLQNDLCKPGAVQVCGQPVDLRSIAVPTYVLATREDHIVPWTSAYQSQHCLGAPVRFVLGASGHIAGVINPASKNKRSHWVVKPNATGSKSKAQGKSKDSAPLPATAQAWLEHAEEVPGSWWLDWCVWLEQHQGPKTPAAKTLGKAPYKPIEPAPGRYVKQRIS